MTFNSKWKSNKFISKFSKPLTLRFYMDINEDIDYEFLKGLIEKREMEIMLHGGKTRIEKVDFKLHSSGEKIDTISKREMLEHFFKSYKSIFNDSISKEMIMTFDIVYPGIEKPLIARQLPTLANYLSLQEGILGLETMLNDEDAPIIRIYYHKDNSSSGVIKSTISQPKWKIRDKNGVIKDVEALLGFK